MDKNFEIEIMRPALFRFIERNLSIQTSLKSRVIHNSLSEARTLASDFPVRFGYRKLAREYERIGMKLLDYKINSKSKFDSVLPVSPEFEWHSLNNHFHARTVKVFNYVSLEKMFTELNLSKQKKMEGKVRQLYDIERLKTSIRMKRFDSALEIIQEIKLFRKLKMAAESETEMVVHDHFLLEEMLKNLCGNQKCVDSQVLAKLKNLFFENIKQIPTQYICDIQGRWRPLYCLELITETWYCNFESNIPFEPDLWIQSPIYGYLKSPIDNPLPEQYDKLLQTK
jgi:hypothetical protein